MTRRLVAVALVLGTLSIVSCSTPAQQENLAAAPIIGQLVLTGSPITKDMGPTTETVWNCGQGGGTIVKHPTMSVTTNYAVAWEVGGTAGVGTTVGKGVIPAGVDLSATLEGRYKKGFDQGVTQGTGWDLPAEQNTNMVYTLMWRETWQPAYVDVTFADKSLIRIDLQYRSGIQSEVVGKRLQSCEGGQSTSPSPTTAQVAPQKTDVLPQQPTVLPTIPTNPVSSSAQSSANFDFGGLCAAYPKNMQDDLEVTLDPSRWYLIEDYDNQINPRTHVFRVQVGNTTVNANAFRGYRAWECRSESAARSEALRAALGFKQANPSYKVIGPDGQEVK